MNKLFFLSFLLLIFTFHLFAQNAPDTLAIKKQLQIIFNRDQNARTNGDSAAFMHYIDSTNLIQVESLIKQYGWPGRSFVGFEGNLTIFLVIQHSDQQTQEKYLPVLEQSVARGESKESHLALLKDRVLMKQGKKQIYGSQLTRDSVTGGWIFYPIEDEKNVNERRSKAGLQPIEEYATYFGIEYKGPK
jgi:hypothetical protein